MTVALVHIHTCFCCKFLGQGRSKSPDRCVWILDWVQECLSMWWLIKRRDWFYMRTTALMWAVSVLHLLSRWQSFIIIIFNYYTFMCTGSCTLGANVLSRDDMWTGISGATNPGFVDDCPTIPWSPLMLKKVLHNNTCWIIVSGLCMILNIVCFSSKKTQNKSYNIKMSVMVVPHLCFMSLLCFPPSGSGWKKCHL